MQEMQVIDIFCHIFPAGFMQELKKRCPHLSFRQAGAGSALNIFNDQSGYWVAYVIPDSAFDTPEKRIEDMDRYGVDIQVLSASLPGAEPSSLSATPEDLIKIARFVNDAIAGVVSRYPDRFLGVAEIPATEEESALEEFDRAVNELGMKAVQLYTQMGGMPIDNERFYPLFERAVKYDLPILLHPSNPPPAQSRSYEKDYSLMLLFGWPYETTLALSRLVISGVLEKFPRLKIVSHHMGGMIAYFGGRLQIYENLAAMRGVKYPKPLLEYFKAFYADTVLGGHLPAAKCGYEVFGPDHIVFATDYPFGPEIGRAFIRQAINIVRELNIPEEEQSKIFHKNARELLNIH
ncbi:MAG: amidohydrolase family protein [Nitrososphaerota archaeon]